MKHRKQLVNLDFIEVEDACFWSALVRQCEDRAETRRHVCITYMDSTRRLVVVARAGKMCWTLRYGGIMGIPKSSCKSDLRKYVVCVFNGERFWPYTSPKKVHGFQNRCTLPDELLVKCSITTGKDHTYQNSLTFRWPAAPSDARTWDGKLPYISEGSQMLQQFLKTMSQFLKRLKAQMLWSPENFLLFKIP